MKKNVKIKMLLLVSFFLLKSVTFQAQVVGTPKPLFRTSSSIIPSTLSLEKNKVYYVASVFDQNYLPYSTPTTAATTATLNPDGVTEPTTIDVQGSISTTGVPFKIPITVTGSGTLPEFSTTITIAAEFTEDNISRELKLSWPEVNYTTSTKYIDATIASVGGTFNAKKLDINAGIGNDASGILIGTFNYPYNSIGSSSSLEIRIVSAIPDKVFGLPDNNGAGSESNHTFLYLPVVAEDGNVWLNNNLGANYSKLGHPSFNPSQQATSRSDINAYGNLFQWGRKADGHEIITYSSSTLGNANAGSTTIQADIPNDVLFIRDFDWRVNSSNKLLEAETSTNNPCPNGFRVPTLAEWTNFVNVTNLNSYNQSYNSLLKLPVSGYRVYNNANVEVEGMEGHYWSSTPNLSDLTRAHYFNVKGSSFSLTDVFKANGRNIRCIKDNTPAASVLTMDCANAVHSGDIAFEGTLENVTTSIPYTGGNAGKHAGLIINSTGVTGLVATLEPGLISTTGNLQFTITGTPSAVGTASFEVVFAGQTCIFTRAVLDLSELLIKLNEARVINSTWHVAIFASNGTLYTWGRGDEGQLGLNSLSNFPRNPRLVTTNLTGETIIQSASGHWASSVALTSSKKVFFCGPAADGGNGQRIFTRAVLGGDVNIKALLLATSEGGSVIIGDNSKMYGIGYYNIGTGTGTVREIVMPTDVTTSQVRFLTGSHHFMLFGTNKKLYYIAGQNSTNWGSISATFTEYTLSTFTNIQGLRVSKDRVAVKDNGVYKYSPNRNTAFTTINTSSITEPIESFQVLGNLVVFITATKFSVFDTTTSTFTANVNLPANSVLEWASPEKISGFHILCKFKNTVTNAITYQTFGRVAVTGGEIADSSVLAFQNANLNLNQLPAGVTF